MLRSRWVLLMIRFNLVLRCVVFVSDVGVGLRVGVAESNYEATQRRCGESVREDKSTAIAFRTTQICDAGEWEMSSGDGSTVFALRARTDDRASPGSRGATIATCGDQSSAG